MPGQLLCVSYIIGALSYATYFQISFDLYSWQAKEIWAPFLVSFLQNHAQIMDLLVLKIYFLSLWGLLLFN